MESPGFGTGIGLATSSDGLTWTDHAAVLPAGLPGSADSGAANYEDAIVVNSQFRIYYSGYDSATGSYSILVATSADGVTWLSTGIALTAAGEGGGVYFVYAPSVYWSGTAYTMWYSTYDGTYSTIRRAASKDGLNGTRTGTVLTASPGIDAAVGPRMPSVARTPTGYVMWYTCGADPDICRARSPDGIAWTRDGVVLRPDLNLPGEHQRVALPSALDLGGENFRIYYCAVGSASAIYAGRTTSGFLQTGWVRSTPIVVPTNSTWLWATVNAAEPAGTTVALTVLNATSGLPLSGYNVMPGNLSFVGLIGRQVPAIEIRATLLGDGLHSPSLAWWAVAYGTPP